MCRQGIGFVHQRKHYTLEQYVIACRLTDLNIVEREASPVFAGTNNLIVIRAVQELLARFLPAFKHDLIFSSID